MIKHKMLRNKYIIVSAILASILILTYWLWNSPSKPQILAEQTQEPNTIRPFFFSSSGSSNLNTSAPSPLEATRARQDRLRRATNFWDYTDSTKHKPTDGEIIYWDRVAGFCWRLSGTRNKSNLTKMQTDSRVAAAYTEYSKLCANKPQKDWVNRFQEIQKALPKDRLFQIRANIYGLNDLVNIYNVNKFSPANIKQGAAEVLAGQDSKIIFNPLGGILIPTLVIIPFFDGKPIEEEFATAMHLASFELECEYGEPCNSANDLRLIESCLDGDCFNSRQELIESLLKTANKANINHYQIAQAKNTLRQAIARGDPKPWLIPDEFTAYRDDLQKMYDEYIAQTIKDMMEEAKQANPTK